MKISVVVPTLNRPDLLARTLAHLEQQDRAPDEVIISAPSAAHVPSYLAERYQLRFIFGAYGSSAQRNIALESLLSTTDIITFFDDDYLPARNYIARVASHFDRMNDVAAMMGHVIVDGARGSGLSFEEGEMALRAAEVSIYPHENPVDLPGTYGCNMSIRAALVGSLRFDERLVLYGWQEDIDFSSQLRCRGRVIKMADLLGVHLGIKTARVSGKRLGYSQVVNPTYLVRKGSMPKRFALNLMARNVTANIVKSLWSEPYVDRRGRLMGNIIGAYHLARGRIEPEYVLKL